MLRGRHMILPMLMLAAPATAAAAPQTAQCADRLGPEERMIHDAAAARLRSGAAPRDAVRAAAIALVREGRLSRRAAPSAAKAAARCLAPAAAR